MVDDPLIIAFLIDSELELVFMILDLRYFWAFSGSFKPFPVNIQTIFLFFTSSPLFIFFNKPAKEAAEAGSQKIPSCLAIRDWADIISSSETLRNSPWVSLTASFAKSELAGFPILIAVAKVLGFSIIFPSTRGAEFSACIPKKVGISFIFFSF